jgi:hypothetical protein
MWAAVMDMAREFNTPPWQIEAECTAEWWFRYWAYVKNVNKAQKNG